MVKGLSWVGSLAEAGAEGVSPTGSLICRDTHHQTTNDVSKAPEHWDPRECVCVWGRRVISVFASRKSQQQTMRIQKLSQQGTKSVTGGWAFKGTGKQMGVLSAITSLPSSQWF